MTGSLAGTFRLPSLAGAVLLQALRATACDLEPHARRWTGQPHPLQPARPGRPLRGVGAAGPVHHRDAGLLPVTALAGSGGGRRAQPRHHKSWLGPGQRMPRERAAPPMPPPSRASHPYHPLARRVPSGTGRNSMAVAAWWEDPSGCRIHAVGGRSPARGAWGVGSGGGGGGGWLVLDGGQGGDGPAFPPCASRYERPEVSHCVLPGSKTRERWHISALSGVLGAVRQARPSS
jgi:hypothetical protein